MPATPIAATDRFMHAGTTKCVFMPAVASLSAPTRSEINAGTDLSPETGAMDGWTVEGGEIETPDLATTFTGKIPGRTSSPDSSLTFYADQQGTDVRTLLQRGTTGFIAWLDGGDVAGNKMSVYPVRVRSCTAVRSVAEEAAMVNVAFSITREPAENITVPA